MKTRDELVNEIASEIVCNKSYSTMEWDSVSVVIRFEPPSIWKGGFMYFGKNYVRKNPTGFSLTRKLVELKKLMAEEDGSEWVSCLIKLSGLTQEIDIDFEYEEVKRWYMTPTMDPKEISDYAMSLK